MTEFELKFEVPTASLKRVNLAVLEGKTTRQRLQASYFDTADGVLAACEIVVRMRKEGRRWVQTAKGPTADVLERLEHSVTLPAQPARTVPALDLSRHCDTPVGKAIDSALRRKANGNYPALSLLYGTDIQRITRLIACGSSVVEVALDQGRVFADGYSQVICELEVELKQGSPSDAVALAQQWCAMHGLWISTIAKSMKGQRLRAAAPFVKKNPAIAPIFTQHASGHEMVAAVVNACMHQILPNMSELASGSRQAEHIHQLRVGIRKLRTALHELDDLTDAIDPAWASVLVQCFRVLGTHRDCSHLTMVMQPQLLAAGGSAMRFDNANGTVIDLGEMVRAPDFQEALLGLLGLVHSQPPKANNNRDNLKKPVSMRLDKLYKHALRDGRKFLELNNTQQHDVRKRLKSLRYLLEFSAPLFANRKVKHMEVALKPVQDALGLYNDELMALQAWRAMAADQPHAWFGIGWLTARQQPNAKRCLIEIKTFAGIKPFWRG